MILLRFSSYWPAKQSLATKHGGWSGSWHGLCPEANPKPKALNPKPNPKHHSTATTMALLSVEMPCRDPPKRSWIMLTGYAECPTCPSMPVVFWAQKAQTGQKPWQKQSRIDLAVQNRCGYDGPHIRTQPPFLQASAAITSAPLFVPRRENPRRRFFQDLNLLNPGCKLKRRASSIDHRPQLQTVSSWPKLLGIRLPQGF